MATRAIVTGLSLAVILDTAGQLLWKCSVTLLPPANDVWPIVKAVFHQPLFLAVGIVFLCQLVNWLLVLEHADLSYAQPITSLSYVTVCALSALLFGEHIGLARAIGILCVLIGVWLLSGSNPKTTRQQGHTP